MPRFLKGKIVQANRFFLRASIFIKVHYVNAGSVCVASFVSFSTRMKRSGFVRGKEIKNSSGKSPEASVFGYTSFNNFWKDWGFIFIGIIVGYVYASISRLLHR